MTETRKCPRRVGSGYYRSACGNPAKGEHGYCGLHSPEAEARRKAKSDAKAAEWNRQWDERRAASRAAEAKAAEERRLIDEELPRLRALLEECNAVCLCGCPPEKHESLGEDGEACGNDRHECIRVAPAVLAHVRKLRGMVVYLAGVAACEANGETDPYMWVLSAQEAAEKSLAGKAADEVRS